MALLAARDSALLLIDLQTRLMPVIDGADAVISNACKLASAAERLGIPIARTEQLPHKLGRTVDELAAIGSPVMEKSAFNACRAKGFGDWLPPDRTIIIAGVETHVCVLQTALGLLQSGSQVCVVADAAASRTQANRLAALERLRTHGAEIVTTEMVLFEWLEDAANPHFREIMALIK